MGEPEKLRVEVARAMLDHLVTTGADLARHKDDVAAVRREVLRGLRR